MTIATVSLKGHLTKAVLETALSAVDASATALLVDTTDMTDYDAGARELFVSWNDRMRDKIGRVAIVTGKPMWRMVITTMAMASRQKMKAFDTISSAFAWLAEP
jgi:hypothetical protein